jgi:putative ABC transport system permease protein
VWRWHSSDKDAIFMTTNEIAASPKRAQPSAASIVLPPLTTSGSGGIRIGEVVRMAFDSLLANKMRSLLTMLGIIIGVASVVALLALGSGASAAITGQIEAIGTNLLTIQPGSPQNQGPGSSGSAQTLTLSDAEAIAALRLPVSGVAPQFSSTTQLVAPAADTNASVVGVTPDYAVVNNLTMAAGSFIDEQQSNTSAGVIVLGAHVAEELFGGSTEAIGQRVRVEGQRLRVIGVLEAEGGGGFGSDDDQAFVPISLAHGQLFGARTPDGNDFQVNSIQLSALNSNDLDAIDNRISVLLRERHTLAADGSEDDFNIFNQASILDTLSTITTLLQVFLGAVAGISLLVGGIGIMNIMLVSVTERTREIGLRKAVGARGNDILLQFVVESLVLSLTGGLIGLATGALIAFLVSQTGLLNASVAVSHAAIAVGFALAIGLFFGIWPARQASKLDPIVALRSE